MLKNGRLFQNSHLSSMKKFRHTDQGLLMIERLIPKQRIGTL